MKKILVAGDLILDKYIFGKVTRISPEAPVPIVNVSSEVHKLGGAANVAHNIVSLHSEVSLTGFLGNDIESSLFIDLLNGILVENKTILKTDFRTIQKTRIIGENQQIVRLDYEKFYQAIEEDIREIDLTNFNYVIISDYGKGFCSKEICQTLISNQHLKVIVDPKGKDWRKYYGAFLITPNFKEFQEYFNDTFENETDLITKKAKEIIEDLNLTYLVVTRSEKGISVMGKNEAYHFNTFAKEVFDVTGAGDTVVAALTVFLNEGRKIEDAVKLANYAAGIAVSKIGTYAVKREEIKDLI